MKEVKAVVFDYGCVLAHEHLESDLEAIASCIRIDLQILKEAYWHFRLDYDAGISVGSQYYQQIAEKCAVSITPAQIKQCVDLDNASWSRPIVPMVDWAQRLRANGIKTAILSNMPQDFRDFLPTITWLPEFDHATYSCELKTVKPSHDIYRHCQNGLPGVSSAEILFIDDRQPNIDAAQKLGWQGFVFKQVDDLHEYVKNTNLPPVLLG